MRDLEHDLSLMAIYKQAGPESRNPRPALEAGRRPRAPPSRTTPRLPPLLQASSLGLHRFATQHSLPKPLSMLRGQHLPQVDDACCHRVPVQRGMYVLNEAVVSIKCISHDLPACTVALPDAGCSHGVPRFPRVGCTTPAVDIVLLLASTAGTCVRARRPTV
ncbi:hypothetical protein K491DRAFT_264349 [Lophiostoma macrostomum CBS 122681]|uniref:Uncharacterized protein n=1 Tax=Lophiostoma macrostomum CBS 122681 TaxID=1314788 RepID=A0A6A6SJH9_9PLEO|nr:hypothetical protein K491DRAFT_264349 [Lophiostoma macrostomum CBS 122681]